MSPELSRKTGERKEAALNSPEGKVLLALMEPNPATKPGEALAYSSDEEVAFIVFPELFEMSGTTFDTTKSRHLGFIAAERAKLIAFLHNGVMSSGKGGDAYRSIIAEIKRRWKSARSQALGNEDIAIRLEERVISDSTLSQGEDISNSLDDWNEKYGHEWFKDITNWKPDKIFGSGGVSEPSLPSGYDQPRADNYSGIKENKG